MRRREFIFGLAMLAKSRWRTNKATQMTLAV